MSLLLQPVTLTKGFSCLNVVMLLITAQQRTTYFSPISNIIYYYYVLRVYQQETRG